MATEPKPAKDAPAQPPRDDGDRRVERKKIEPLPREQTETEVERCPYLDTEGGE